MAIFYTNGSRGQRYASLERNISCPQPIIEIWRPVEGQCQVFWGVSSLIISSLFMKKSLNDKDISLNFTLLISSDRSVNGISAEAIYPSFEASRPRGGTYPIVDNRCEFSFEFESEPQFFFLKLTYN